MRGCENEPAQVVRAFVDAWNRLDMDGVVALLAPDIDYHNMPMEPIAGKAAVERYLRSVGPFDSCDWRIVSMAVDGDTVLTERVDAFVVDGTPIALPLMGVFEIEDGLIRRWRDYFDLASYRAQWPVREAAQ